MRFLNKVQEIFKNFFIKADKVINKKQDSLLNEQVRMILNEDLNISNLEYESLFLDTLLRDDKLLNELLPKDDLISKRILQIYLIKILYKIEEEKTGKSFEILFERFTTKENKRMIFNLQSEFALLEEYRQSSLNNDDFLKIRDFLEKIKYEKKIHLMNPTLFGIDMFFKHIFTNLFNKYLIGGFLNILGSIVIFSSMVNWENLLIMIAKLIIGSIFIFVGFGVAIYEE